MDLLGVTEMFVERTWKFSAAEVKLRYMQGRIKCTRGPGQSRDGEAP